MRYNKPPLTYSAQANNLIEKGMSGNKDFIISKLKAVGYYRLNDYWLSFVRTDGTVESPASIDDVWRRYTFDRQLRLLVLDAIERFEVSVRTNVIYVHSHNYGPFGYLNRDSLPRAFDKKVQRDRYLVFMTQVNKACRECESESIVRFNAEYGDQHDYPPLWMLSEVVTFGNMLYFFKAMKTKLKKSVAFGYGVEYCVFESWLMHINSVRNVCAHHGRLWNRELGIKPSLPKKSTDWQGIGNRRVFVTLTILRYLLLRISPESSWMQRFDNLLCEYRDIPLRDIGFPERWRENPMWRI